MSTATRRELMEQIAAGLIAVAAAPAGWAQAARAAAPAGAVKGTPPSPVVSFFLDQPYLDLTGTAKPYIPPRGLRGLR